MSDLAHKLSPNTNYKAIADVVEEQWIKFPHTEEDTVSINANLSKHAVERANLEAELKDIQDEYKPKLDREKKAIAGCIVSLKRGYEEEKMEVYGIADHEKGTMEFYDGAGTVVSSRRLLPEERQLTIRSNF